jgi:hypothetical protein
VEVIEQSMHRVPQAHKRDLLAHLIKHHDWQQVLVFTRTKHGANKLAEKLIKDGISAAAIHGNKSQSARTKALASFKDGSVRVLVATDIAARGIDIDQLPQVVNFELPNVPEDYVHRIGRTGRAGSTGSALSLVDDEELSYLRDIEKLIKRAAPAAGPWRPATGAGCEAGATRGPQCFRPRFSGQACCRRCPSGRTQVRSAAFVACSQAATAGSAVLVQAGNARPLIRHRAQVPRTASTAILALRWCRFRMGACVADVPAGFPVPASRAGLAQRRRGPYLRSQSGNHDGAASAFRSRADDPATGSCRAAAGVLYAALIHRRR